MSATIRDVAKTAHVGIATVSRVLNNNPSVSPETRERVLQVIQELDYSPNPAAQRLSLGKTQTISVVMPYLTAYSFVERLRGIQKAMESTDYDLILYSWGNLQRRDQLISSLPRKAATDGVLILAMLPNEEQIERFIRSDTPLVLIDAEHPRISSVFVDNMAGGFMATNYLLELGHQEIGFIGHTLDNVFRISHTRKRYDGYRLALAEWEVPFNPQFFKQVDMEIEAAKQAALEILSGKDRPSAIFASSDIHAVGIIRAAESLNLQVPDDLSVIGYDDIHDAELLHITTIRQPLFESGVEGTNQLLKEIRDGTRKPDHIKQDVELIIRGTTTAH